MDDPKAVILDISSDEETGFDFGGDGGGDEFKLLSELFGEDNDKDDDYNNDTGESDDVVVVGEVFVNPKRRITKSPDSVSKIGGDGDDDCVVLDGDPDKPVALVNEKEVEDADDSDDLVVIREKGEVACRDFPHSRHACANFPFASTPHEKYCEQCHCYVCDSLAPCVAWGTGISSTDHCHATDKDEFWKAQRKSSMRNDKALPVVTAVTDSALLMSSSVMNQPSSLPSNFAMQNQVLRHEAFRPSPGAPNNGMQKVTRLGRIPHPGYAVPRSRFQPNFVRQHLRSTNNHATDRRPSNGNMVPHFTTSRMMFKRTQSVGSGLTTERSGYHLPGHNYGFSRNAPSTARLQGVHGGAMPVSNPYEDSYLQNVGQVNSTSPQTELPTQPILGNGHANYMPPHLQMPSQQNVSSGYVNSVPPHPQMSSPQHISSGYANYVPQTSSQQQVGGVFSNSVPSQPLVSSEHHVNDSFGNLFAPQPQIASQPFVGGSLENPSSTQHQASSLSWQDADRTSEYSESSQPQASWQFEAGNAFQCLEPSLSMTSSLTNTEITLENPLLPHQPQNNNQPTLIPNNIQGSMQQTNPTLDASGSNAAVLDFSLLMDNTPSSQQISVENPQIQSAESTNNPSGIMELYSQFPDSTDSSDLLFNDDWFFEHESFPGDLQVSEPPGLHVPSPDPASLGGLFSDF